MSTETDRRVERQIELRNAEAERWRSRVAALEAERDSLSRYGNQLIDEMIGYRAALARVTALCDDWEDSDVPNSIVRLYIVPPIRAALLPLGTHKPVGGGYMDPLPDPIMEWPVFDAGTPKPTEQIEHDMTMPHDVRFVGTRDWERFCPPNCPVRLAAGTDTTTDQETE